MPPRARTRPLRSGGLEIVSDLTDASFQEFLGRLPKVVSLLACGLLLGCWSLAPANLAYHIHTSHTLIHRRRRTRSMELRTSLGSSL